MRWERGHQSSDVIDRRGAGGAGAGLLGLIPLLLRSRLGWGGIVLVLLIFGAYYGWSLFGPGASGLAGDRGRSSAPDQPAEFTAFVLDDAQNTWSRAFDARGRRYSRAKLVLFDDRTSTGCGFGVAATGPFYCPLDQRIYLDLGFFAELERRLGAAGDFAQAYVIAHEVGHHVQRQLGTLERGRDRETGPDSAAVRVELQADCFAGVWAHSTAQRDLLERGDVEEALGAAAAVGDDRLQRAARGTVQPEKWTHGSAAQRAQWFRRGLESGKPESCDTFAADTP
jgi:predicted metalloprotease